MSYEIPEDKLSCSGLAVVQHPDGLLVLGSHCGWLANVWSVFTKAFIADRKTGVIGAEKVLVETNLPGLPLSNRVIKLLSSSNITERFRLLVAIYYGGPGGTPEIWDYHNQTGHALVCGLPISVSAAACCYSGNQIAKIYVASGSGCSVYAHITEITLGNSSNQSWNSLQAAGCLRPIHQPLCFVTGLIMDCAVAIPDSVLYCVGTRWTSALSVTTGIERVTLPVSAREILRVTQIEALPWLLTDLWRMIGAYCGTRDDISHTVYTDDTVGDAAVLLVPNGHLILAISSKDWLEIDPASGLASPITGTEHAFRCCSPGSFVIDSVSRVAYLFSGISARPTVIAQPLPAHLFTQNPPKLLP